MSPFDRTRAFPDYLEPATYVVVGEQLRPWEFNGWKPESLSWKKSCYIHTGLSGGELCLDGPDADEFVQLLCTNNLQSFPEGTMRHAVMCEDNGLIAAHGILQRYESGLYRHFAAGPWAHYKALSSKFDVRAWWEERYLMQIAGPRSLEALQRVTGEDLTDIGFLRYRNTTIAGKVVEIGRIGMSGNLAYEVRGPIADGATVFDKIFETNREIGMERLGWRTYLVNHVEGGFPQAAWTFGMAMVLDEGFRQYLGADHFALHAQRTGSFDPSDVRVRMRNPFEVNWGKAVRFDHEFVGRKALERVAGGPHRRTVTLRWNADDVVDIYASLFRPGEEYRTLDLPTTPTWAHGMNEHADRVTSGDRLAGVSSSTIYSYHFRECLSMGCVDPEYADLGTELVVHWGDHGGRIKQVRATVDRFPLLHNERNSDI